MASVSFFTRALADLKGRTTVLSPLSEATPYVWLRRGAESALPRTETVMPLCARLCLRIQTMEGELVPFEVNEVPEVLTDIS